MQLSPRHLTKGISIRDILLIIETALIKLYIFNVSRKKRRKEKNHCGLINKIPVFRHF